MSLRGLVAGSLALIALQAIVGSAQSATRFGGIFTGVAGLVESAMSPSVPLVPDLAGVGTGSFGTDSGSGGSGGLGGGGGGGGGGGSW